MIDRERPTRVRGRSDAGASHAGHLRGLNLERILLAAMDRSGTFTRAELINATGLSAPTVGSVADFLIRRGLITDLGTAPSRGGRRPGLMAFNAQHRFIAGIDVGPTYTRLALADIRGERVAHRIIQTPVGEKPVGLLRHLATALEVLMHDNDVTPDRLIAVGAGAPGVTDFERGVVVVAPNLDGWANVPMRDLLQEKLGVRVLVENDVNLAVLGEHWKGAARGHDTCVFIFVGTGIGAGVLIDGALHRGHHYMAGEIGFMCMGPQYVDVEYLPHGCLETLAALPALASRYPAAAKFDPARWVAQLVETAAAGDADAQRALHETMEIIGIAVGNVGMVLDPSLIVLGGAMFARAEALVTEVRTIVERAVPSRMEIVLSSLGKEAPLEGCLLIASQYARETLQQELRAAS